MHDLVLLTNNTRNIIMQNDWKLNIYNKRYYYLKFVTKTVGLCAVTLASKLHFTFPLFVRPTNKPKLGRNQMVAILLGRLKFGQAS